MRLTETPLSGAYLVHLSPHTDERGFFARSYTPQDFRALGVDAPALDQSSIAFNEKCATLRGMHYQLAPHEEHKLVRCTAGRVFDVIVDLRQGSQSFREWYGVELSAANRTALFIPPGLAHGYVTLCEHSEVYYMISGIYSAEHARGVRWNDPALGISWPITPAVIAPRDAGYPLLGGTS
jgi:dTDP-4-dehydrorhamnose 3,5-epimerase